MRITERFNRLSLWRKLGVIGALASIAAVAFSLIQSCRNSSTSTSSSAPVSVNASPKMNQNVNLILSRERREAVQLNPTLENDTKNDDGPPTFPDPAGIADPPTQKKVESPPVVPGRNVTLSYRNKSRVRLRLLLYDWYYHYHPLDKPLAPKPAWRRLNFLEDGNYQRLSDFERGTGWYSFYVEEVETGKQYQCETRQIFDSERPTITVKSVDDTDNPYVIEFGVEEQP